MRFYYHLPQKSFTSWKLLHVLNLPSVKHICFYHIWRKYVQLFMNCKKDMARLWKSLTCGSEVSSDVAEVVMRMLRSCIVLGCKSSTHFTVCFAWLFSPHASCLFNLFMFIVLFIV